MAATHGQVVDEYGSGGSYWGRQLAASLEASRTTQVTTLCALLTSWRSHTPRYTRSLASFGAGVTAGSGSASSVLSCMAARGGAYDSGGTVYLDGVAFGEAFVAAIEAAAGPTPEELAEAARVEAARVEAARVEAARVEAARVEAARVEAARVEAARVEAARVEAARVEAARVEADRVEAARVEAARVEAVRVAEAKRLAAIEAAAVAETQAEDVDDFDEDIVSPLPVERNSMTKYGGSTALVAGATSINVVANLPIRTLYEAARVMVSAMFSPDAIDAAGTSVDLDCVCNFDTGDKTVLQGIPIAQAQVVGVGGTASGLSLFEIRTRDIFDGVVNAGTLVLTFEATVAGSVHWAVGVGN